MAYPTLILCHRAAPNQAPAAAWTRRRSAQARQPRRTLRTLPSAGSQLRTRALQSLRCHERKGAAVPPAPAPTPIPAPAQAAPAASGQPAAAPGFRAALRLPTIGQAHVAAGGVGAGGHMGAWQAKSAPPGQAHPASDSAQAVAGGVGADGSMGAWQAGAAAAGPARPNADPAHAAAGSAGAAGSAAGDQAYLNAHPNPNPHPYPAGLGGVPGAVLAQQQQQVVAAAPQAAEQQLMLRARRLQQARTCPLCVESYARCRYGSAPHRRRPVRARTRALSCARRAHGV